MAYPFGILGGMLSFQLFAWIYRRPAEKERQEAEARARKKSDIASACFKVTRPEVCEKPIGELRVQEKTGLIISRHKQGGEVHVATKYSILRRDDVVKVVGTHAGIQAAEAYFGAKSDEHLERIGETVTMRRILVSRRELAGRVIKDLALDHRFNARITRLRRGDVDIIPGENATIQLGDRVRVVMPADRTREVAQFFGDSERGLTNLDYTAFTLGISLGVLIGMIPIPIPGGASVSLGFAGGPLVAGLVLGKLGRTGPLVWSMPTESNQAIRHVGLLFFLAAVGVMAGGRFFTALAGDGWRLFVLGTVTTTATTGLTLLLLRHCAKATIVESIGAASGMQTQPATLARAYEMSRSDDTYVAYATTYPVAMVGKILLGQILLIVASLLLGR